jgi:hypothetical protein
MTKRKLRKNADISPTQSPQNGIHACSKGCTKCSRELQETIEEQDIQIAALKLDILERSAELRRLNNFCSVTIIPNEILKAQVERLTRAGDAMASSIQFNEEMAQDYNGPTIVHQSVQRWNAAKEGKGQP